MRPYRSLSRRNVLLGSLAACLSSACRNARRPGEQQTSVARATPSASSAPVPPKPASHRFAFFADADQFTRKLPPGPGDWLARFPERHQTFREYVDGDPVRRTAARNKIVVQPLGDFDDEHASLLSKLREYTEIFFDTKTVLATRRALPREGRRTRAEGGTRWTQHSTRVLLDKTLPPMLPADAVACLGVTLGDLYPDDDWNYVFGQASLESRVGVYSLVRFFPEFWRKPSTEAARLLGLRRSLHLLAHEAGHMFSLPHCVRYECLMNGSNSLEEADRQAGVLCPECLRKLHHNLAFDVHERYARLRAFYRREGLEDLSSWIDARLDRISKAAP